MKKYIKVLSIAGSDSGGGAGVQADIKTISALGAYAATAITAITAQNTLGVRMIGVVEPELLEIQIRAVLEDVGADGVKIGMIAGNENVGVIERVLKDFMREGVLKNVVLDPVLVATSGDTLAGQEVKRGIIEKLFPLSDLITPNMPEAQELTQMKGDSQDKIIEMGHALQKMGARNVLIKGGHNPHQGTVIDTLFMGDEILRFRAPYYDTINKHGTGCSLSSAIATFLAQGNQMPQAVERSIKFVSKAILAGAEYSLGQGNGPIKHFFKFWK